MAGTLRKADWGSEQSTETRTISLLMLLAPPALAARLSQELESCPLPFRTTLVDDLASARSGWARRDWSMVVAVWGHRLALHLLEEAPTTSTRVLVAEELTEEVLFAAQKVGAVLCTLSQCGEQLCRVLDRAHRATAAQRTQQRRRDFDSEQMRILERMASGAALELVLDRVVRMIERFGEGACSILLVQPDTGRVRHAAAPSLPPAFVAAIDGSPIGPTAGSCGAAAYTGRAVYVHDIASHPNWEAYRDLALPLGLRACWSTPILGSDGQVLGTFAVYYDKPRDPSPEEVKRVASASHLAALAISKQRHERALHLSERRYRQLLETSHEGIMMLDVEGLVTFANRRAAAMLGYAPQELLGKCLQELAHPSERRGAEQVLRRRREGLSEQYERHYLRRDGGDLFAIVAASPIIDERGQVIGMLKMLTDITERRRAEEALARSELELRSIFESTTMAVALLDADARPIRCNSALSRMLGYDAEELKQRSLMSLVHPEDEPVIARIRERLNRGEISTAHQELRMLRNGGEPCWVRANTSRLVYPVPTNMVGVVVLEDISEQKRLEHEFDAEQRLIALIYDSVTEIITYLKVEPEEQYRYVSVNQAFCRWFGLRPQEVVGKTTDQVPAAFAPDIASLHYREAVELGCTVRWEEMGQQPTGTEYAERTATPVCNGQGVCTHLIVTSRVITDRKRDEAKLAKQAALIDRASDAIIVCSLDHEVRFWNASAARLYGYTSEEAMGQSVATLLYRDASQLLEAWQELLATGAWSGELRQVAKDERDIVVDASCTMLYDSRGQPESVLAIHTDATEKKKLEDQVMLAQRMESLGTLAGGIAHDFNNILAAIRGYLDMAVQVLPNDSPARELLEVVDTATDRAVALVQQILTFSRRKAARRAPVRLQPVVEEVLRLLRATLPRMINIESEYADEDLPVLADATQVHQIVMNLGTNAAQAMDGHGTVQVRLTPVTLREKLVGVANVASPGTYMCLTVADDGCGMDADTLEHAFDPFFTTKAAGVGTGLGLSVVLGIVKDHGGVLRADSKRGQGTTFEIYLPVVETDHATTRKALSNAGELRGDGQRILCVDDEAPLLRLEQTYLQGLGYQVDAFSNPTDALHAIQEQPGAYAALVTDLAMANLSGLELASRARALRPDLPIILSSGFLRPEDREQAQTMGIDAVLSKPDVLQPLARELAQLLRERAAAH